MEDTEMADDVTKVAGQVPGVLNAAAQHMRKLASTNVELLKRASAAEHELRLMKLARRMESRGLEPAVGFDDKVAQLRNIAVEKLAATEQAVELAAGGFRLGTTAEPMTETKVASGENYRGGDNGDNLENFVLSQEAFG